MADWFVRFKDQATGIIVGEYSLMQPEVEVRNSEPGHFSGELALGQTKRGSTTLGIARDEFGPYRTHYEVWRQSTGAGVCVSDGMLTSINLNFNRDTVLIAGKDWKHYLQRRIYPFTPEDYIEFNADAPSMFWDKWPKRWPSKILITDPTPDPVPVKRIVRDLLLSMRTGQPVDFKTTSAERNSFPDADGVPNIVWNINATNGTTISTYKIYPGDQTSIYDHIDKLSQMKDGFEWDITPLSLEFKLWMPTKYATNVPAYSFAVTGEESGGAIQEFDWTNDGPDGTYLIGLGSGRHKIGAVWTYGPSVTQFGRYDLVYDYGEIQGYDVILQKLKDQNDLHPQKKLSLVILNPEFLPLNFYTADRPRSLVANTVRVTRDFAPLHKVDAYFKVNAIRWNVDASTNEYVALELEMVYEPEGTSGGL